MRHLFDFKNHAFEQQNVKYICVTLKVIDLICKLTQDSNTNLALKHKHKYVRV